MKDNITGFVKLFLLVCMMTLGFLTTYATIYQLLGFTLTKYALLGCVALSMVSVMGYLSWITEIRHETDEE